MGGILGSHFSVGIEYKLLLFYFDHHASIFFHVGLMLLPIKLRHDGHFEGICVCLLCFEGLLDKKWLDRLHELLIVIIEIKCIYIILFPFSIFHRHSSGMLQQPKLNMVITYLRSHNFSK